MLQFIEKKEGITQPDKTISLPWEKRIKSRLRIMTLDGVEAGIVLPRGTFLRGGDTLIAEDGTSLLIKGAPEEVSVVNCSDNLFFARLCYHLGNRHVALEIGANTLRYLHDHVLDEMVVQLGGTVVVEEIPFEPEHGAYSGGHAHSHSHSHSHD